MVRKMKLITAQEAEGLFRVFFQAEKGVCFVFPHYQFQSSCRRWGFHQEIVQGSQLCTGTAEANDLLCGERGAGQ